jgi:hypothetical protein
LERSPKQITIAATNVAANGGGYSLNRLNLKQKNAHEEIASFQVGVFSIASGTG